MPKAKSLASVVLDPDHEDTNVDPRNLGESKDTIESGATSSSSDVTAESTESGVVPPPVETPITIHVPARTVEAVDVRLPLIPVPDDDKLYVWAKVEVRLTPRQSRALRGVFDALHGTHQQMDNGQHVDKMPHAVQWILDRVASVYESPSAN